MSLHGNNLIDLDLSLETCLSQHTEKTSCVEEENIGENPFDSVLVKANNINLHTPENKLNGSHLKTKYYENEIVENLLQLSPSSCEEFCLGNKDTDDFYKNFENKLNLSKILDDSSDDIMSTTLTLIDSEHDFDRDLEMLKIPILDKLNIDSSLSSSTVQETEYVDTEMKDSRSLVQISNKLEELKQKFKIDKDNIDNKDAIRLINELKLMISKCPNEEKKSQAEMLLESLECIVKSDKNVGEEEKDNNKSQFSLNTPKNILRQNTFDVKTPQSDPDSPINEMEKIKYQLGNRSDIIFMKSPPQTIVDEIDKILNEKNILQSSEETSNLDENRTYIFVMATPKSLKRQSSEIFERKRESPDDNNQHRRRSKSLSGNKNEFSTPVQSTNLKTPNRSMVYANYIHGKSPVLLQNKPIFKKIESTQKLLNADKGQEETKTKILNRRSINLVQDINIGSKIATKRNQNKLRVKSNEIYSKTQGPMKATIPVIKVAPMLVPPENQNYKLNNKSVIDEKLSINNGKTASSLNRNSKSPSERLSIDSNIKSESKDLMVSHHQRRSILIQKKSPRIEFEINDSKINSTKSTKPTQDFLKTINKLTPIKMRSETLKQGQIQRQKRVSKENKQTK